MFNFKKYPKLTILLSYVYEVRNIRHLVKQSVIVYSPLITFQHIKIIKHFLTKWFLLNDDESTSTE